MKRIIVAIALVAVAATAHAVRIAVGGDPTPIATMEVAGKVKPDGTSVTVDGDGTIRGVSNIVFNKYSSGSYTAVPGNIFVGPVSPGDGANDIWLDTSATTGPIWVDPRDVAGGTINDAVDYAATSGPRTVIVPEGTYSGAITLLDGITLQCLPGAVITIPDAANTHVVTVPAGATATIRGCVIDGNRAGQSATSRGIQGYAVAGLTLDGTEIRNTYSEGVRIDATTDGSTTNAKIRVINGSNIHNTGKSGVWVLEKTDGLEITNSIIADWGASVAASDAVLLSMHGNDWIKNVNISFNKFAAASSNLFAVESVGEVLNLEMTGNIQTGLYHGYSFQAKNAVVTKNIFADGQGNWRSGMETIITNGEVSGNIIANGSMVFTATDASLDSLGPPLVSSKVNVHHNNVSNSGSANTSGIYVSGTATNASSFVNVHHNTIDMTGAAGSFNGILAGTYSTTGLINNISVEKNRIKRDGGRTRHAIKLAGASGSSAVSISGNTASGFDSGVWLSTSNNFDQVDVTHNNFWDNTTPIFNESSSGTYRFYGNVTANTETGFNLGTTIYTDTANARFGIGTAAPDGPLHVYKSDTTKAEIYLENGTSKQWVSQVLGSGVSGRVGNFTIRDVTDSKTGIEITPAGNIGIGGQSAMNSAAQGVIAMKPVAPPDAGLSGAVQIFGANTAGASTAGLGIRAEDGNITKIGRHFDITGTKPTLSACGTSPTIPSGCSDHAGMFTIGATGTGCTVTFATAYTNAPACIVSGDNAVASSATTSALTVVAAPGTYAYVCYGIAE